MPLIAKKTGDFTPAPEGLWPAVCVDVVDLGILKQVWQGREKSVHKCRIMWELSETMEDGRRFIVGKRYTVSLHEKSQLHKDLKSWRGKAFTTEELSGFDVEKILNAPCQLVITHEEKDGTVYANITAIMRANKATAIQPSGKYVRMKDRPTEQKTSNDNGHNGNPDYAEDEPFSEPPEDEGYATGADIPF
jgi:hypothetical protein